MTEAGVVLLAWHARRLAPEGPGALEALARFAETAPPGCWSLWADGDALRVERRPETRMSDGMATRTAISPFAGGRGAFPKPASPSAYDAVRVPGVSTLLTSADGTEIFESCTAAVLAWDGQHVVCSPDDRPRVWSTAEAAIRERLDVRAAPLAATSPAPLLLVNALKGTCRIAIPGRGAFPDAVVRQIDAVIEASTSCALTIF